MHFFNPVPVLKLVEVIRAVQTSDETAAAIVELARDLGKEPAEARDFPGFVSNRILMPFINEAAYALMEGVAEAEAIDTIAKLGFAHPMGPLALADLIGLDTCVAIMEVLHRGLGNPKYAPCPLLRQYVQAGRLGRKCGRGFYALLSRVTRESRAAQRAARDDAEVGPAPALLALDEAGLEQDLQVVADRRLRRPSGSVRWQTQASPPGCAWIRLRSRRRAGSARALSAPRELFRLAGVERGPAAAAGTTRRASRSSSRHTY